MSAKYNGIIKFSLSLKMKKKRSILPPPKCLFSVQPVFFAIYKKTLETNICLKYLMYKFCLRRFSLKCIMKKNYLSPYCPLKSTNPQEIKHHISAKFQKHNLSNT